MAGHHTKKRILVVDDERDITITLQVGLEEDAGFDVDAFTDPELALSSFKPGKYHLVIIDIIMPGIDGFELHKQIKKVDPLVKLCFLTASEMHREEFRKEKYCDLGKDLFLKMPMPIKEIIGEINKRLAST